jgi:Aerotolerance regulator N-terminal
VTFAAAGALAGLALLAPLVLLHLRRRGQIVREVPSLLLWEEIELLDAKRSRGLRWPSLPLLLLLQALALALLVFALAEPTSPGSRSKPLQVFVLDDSWRMQAPGRIAEARREVARLLAADTAGTPVRIVLADGLPHLLYRGDPAGAAAALAHVGPSTAPPDLATALTIASGLLSGAHDQVLLIRAPEDPLPALQARPGEFSSITLPPTKGDQGIFDAGARCGIGASTTCEIYATVRNTTVRTVEDLVSADAAGRPPLSVTVRVGRESSAPLTLVAEPDQQVSLSLQGDDPLPADDRAWVTVPAAGDLPSSSTVTLVGSPAVALPTARAFAAVPGVALTLRTRATYRADDAAHSSLVVLDHWLPRGGLPHAPAVLLVDPPRAPQGHVDGTLGEAVVSGTDASSELMAGVELSSLSIDSHAAAQLSLPSWLAPVIWSPDGDLLAAGDDGRQRVAVMSFEPGQSNLPQLPALPILAANIVQWASGWAPASASAGVPFAVDAIPGTRSLTLSRAGTVVKHLQMTGDPVSLDARRPGLYTLRESGASASRVASVAVNTAQTSAGALESADLSSARLDAGNVPPVNRAFWFLLGALVVLTLEWGYWISRRRGVAL